MPSRTTFLLFLAATLSFAPAPGWGFYMPPAFDIDAVPGYEQGGNSSATGSQTSTAATFDMRNQTGTTHAGPESTSVATQTTPTLPTAASEDTKSESDRSFGPILPRDVWSPPIIKPDANAVWTAGAKVEVVWDTSTRPQQVTNYEGLLVLGFLEDGDETNEHLDFDHPLAEGFNLTQGQIHVRVPYVDSANDYIVVLFGDSGNRSPRFTIVN
ncbi:hypothetical protein ONZ51_g9129 [Trametes cubensis]|uniref:Uncharacterized protein n=1 Tax=Trametes cubensis TaxID=1111947 RepID=A0AAD7TN62_9APHY|nr:hypothetical protein ONZ51_g9129 [Trametes cubensis]